MNLKTMIEGRIGVIADMYDKRDRGEELHTHVSTGIKSLDDVGLIERGILTVVAAETGHGKSTFALAIMAGAAKSGNDVVGFFFEDSDASTSDRILASMTGLSAFDLRRAKLPHSSGALERKLLDAVDNAAWLDRVSIYTEIVTPDDMENELELHLTNNTGLVVLDYAQVYSGSGGESTERVINEVTIKLNEFAKRHNVAVVLLSQINSKAVAERGMRGLASWKYKHNNEVPDRTAIQGFVPTMNDLAWSSALVQKSRCVVILFRPTVILKEYCGIRDMRDDVMEVAIAKNNYGEAGSRTFLRFEGKTAQVTASTGDL